MGVEKTTVMVLKVDLQCSCCYKKVKKVLCRIPQIRDQIYDEKANTVTITVVCCSPERVQDKLCYKGGKTIKSIDIKEPGKPKASPADKPKEAEKPKDAPKPKEAEKPKEAPKPAEKPKEAAKPAEKPKDAPNPKEAEKPKEAAKPAEKPKEAAKPAEKPKGDAKPAGDKPAGDKPPAQAPAPAPAPAPKAPAPEQGMKAAEMTAFHPVSVFGYPQGYPVGGMSYEPSYEGYNGVPSYQGYGTPVPVPMYNDLYGPYGHIPPPPPPSYGHNPNHGYGFDGGYGNAPAHHHQGYGGNREYFTEDNDSTCTIM